MVSRSSRARAAHLQRHSGRSDHGAARPGRSRAELRASWSVAMSRSGRPSSRSTAPPIKSSRGTLTCRSMWIDLTELPVRAIAKLRLERRAIEDARRPFDLARGPLARVSLLRLGDAEHVVLLTMHHLITDGWSLSVAASELVTLYESDRRGSSVSAPAPTNPVCRLCPLAARPAREWSMAESDRSLEEPARWRATLGAADGPPSSADQKCAGSPASSGALARALPGGPRSRPP